MSIYNYFYFLTTPNSKLYSLIEILYQNVNEKFIVLVKNNEQMMHLHSFLKTKSIYSECVDAQNMSLESIFSNMNICIVSDVLFKKLERNISFCTIINLYGSMTRDQILEKYAVMQQCKDGKLIELISKNDFDFIQLLYKDKDFTVKKYNIKDTKNEFKKSFISDFVNKCLLNKDILKSNMINDEDYDFFNSLFKDIAEEEKNEFLRDFYLYVSFYGAIPTLNVTDGNKKYRKIYIQIHQGLLDRITKKQIGIYFQECPDVEVLEVKKLDQSKAIICAKGYNLKANIVTQFIDTHLFDEQILGYTVINEELANQECNKDRSKVTNQGFVARKKYNNYGNGNDYYSPRYENRDNANHSENNNVRARFNSSRPFRKNNDFDGGSQEGRRYSQFRSDKGSSSYSSDGRYNQKNRFKNNYNKYQWQENGSTGSEYRKHDSKYDGGREKESKINSDSQE